MVFSVMPSSAPVERVFSVTRRVKNKRRAQLSHDSLECLTLINMNHDVIEEIRSSKAIEKLEMPSVNFEVTREDDLRLEEEEDLVEEDLDEEEVHEDNQDIDDEEEVQEEEENQD